MTAIEATVGNNSMSKVFTKNTTDNIWGNPMLDALSGQQLGIIMPGVTINRIQVRGDPVGISAFRVQNAATLQYSRWGFGVPMNTACFSSQAIQPYRVNPNDLIDLFTVPEDPTPNQANVLAWVQTTKGVELFSASGVMSGMPTPMTTVVNGQSLGDSMFNSTLQSMHFSLEMGAALTKVEIVDNQGGVVHTLQGSIRGTAGGSMSLQYNLKADGLAIALGKGWALKVTVLAI